MQIKTYTPQNVPICTMQDWEFMSLIDACCELFGSKLTENGLGAYSAILMAGFRMTTDKQIYDVCMQQAVNPSVDQVRLTPRILAGFLKSNRKPVSAHYSNFEPSDVDKAQIKQQWLTDLYKGFEDYCDKKDIKTIHVWNYLAEKMVRAGLVTIDQHKQAHKVNEARNKQRQEFSTIGQDFANGYKELCLRIFNDLAMQGKHINQYLN